MERLQKVIAEAGITSRRKAEELILKGKVRVNGHVVDELGTKVKGNDVVEVDGVMINKDIVKKYYLLNKPRGVISSVSDDRFQTDYISLDEFFDKGLITNYEIEGGYSLFEYNDIVLCLKRFIGNENYLSFIKEDKVKRVSGGKRIDLDKEKIKQAIIKKVLVACNIQNKKVGRK